MIHIVAASWHQRREIKPRAKKGTKTDGGLCSHQQGDEELVQVDNLDAAQSEGDLPVHLGGVRVALSLGGTGV